MYEAFPAYGGINLFCGRISSTKQIFTRVFGRFCLILPHDPHVFESVRQLLTKNMRLMREYEDRVFKGIYLFRIVTGMRPAQNMRQGMRKYEAHPHVFARRNA